MDASDIEGIVCSGPDSYLLSEKLFRIAIHHGHIGLAAATIPHLPVNAIMMLTLTCGKLRYPICTILRNLRGERPPKMVARSVLMESTPETDDWVMEYMTSAWFADGSPHIYAEFVRSAVAEYPPAVVAWVLRSYRERTEPTWVQGWAHCSNGLHARGRGDNAHGLPGRNILLSDGHKSGHKSG